MRVAVALTLCMLLAGCVVPNQDDPTETGPEPEPSSAPPDSSPPREAPVPHDIIFEIEENVPSEDLESIKAGIARGQRYIEEELNASFPNSSKPLRVVVVARGYGDAPPGGSGGCCNSQESEAPYGSRVFIDTAHPDWKNQNGPGGLAITHEKIAAHEFVHTWQMSIGCSGVPGYYLGFWLNEGIAEMVAYRSMIADGLVDENDVNASVLEIAQSSGQLDRPLRNLTAWTPDVWPGEVGYMALQQLVPNANEGMASLRIICEQHAAGASVDGAFQAAFSTSLDQFYENFETWKSNQAW